ncbi:MAG: SH3 domain-containing C40 family peptidase [Gemmatimonadaceae bacterium]
MTLEPTRAIVRSPVAPLFEEPSISSVQISQVLGGHAVEVLDESDGWCSVRGRDHYVGWMHRGYLHEASAMGDDARAPSRLSLGCVVSRASGRRRSLPLGAYLHDGDELLSGEVVDVEQQAHRFPRAAAAITLSARCYFEGTSYLWGGVTPWGADCSGLVQATFALHGVPLPRDAWQQASEGLGVDASPFEASEGDLLFFSDRPDRHVTHVAIALGAGGLVHLALGRGGFCIERLDDASDEYVATLVARFVCARRVL